VARSAGCRRTVGLVGPCLPGGCWMGRIAFQTQALRGWRRGHRAGLRLPSRMADNWLAGTISDATPRLLTQRGHHFTPPPPLCHRTGPAGSLPASAWAGGGDTCRRYIACQQNLQRLPHHASFLHTIRKRRCWCAPFIAPSCTFLPPRRLPEGCVEDNTTFGCATHLPPLSRDVTALRTLYPPQHATLDW